jgi:hypothetical protein
LAGGLVFLIAGSAAFAVVLVVLARRLRNYVTPNRWADFAERTPEPDPVVGDVPHVPDSIHFGADTI